MMFRDGPTTHKLNFDEAFGQLTAESKSVADIRRKIVVLARQSEEAPREFYDLFLFRKGFEDLEIDERENGLCAFNLEISPKTTHKEVARIRSQLEQAIGSIIGLTIIRDENREKVA